VDDWLRWCCCCSPPASAGGQCSHCIPVPPPRWATTTAPMVMATARAARGMRLSVTASGRAMRPRPSSLPARPPWQRRFLSTALRSTDPPSRILSRPHAFPSSTHRPPHRPRCPDPLIDRRGPSDG
jgi:hypothetical protein